MQREVTRKSKGRTLKVLVPHWEATQPEVLWPIYEDFRNFVIVLWRHLGLPAPTIAQLEIAHRLQYGYDSVEWETLDPSFVDGLFAVRGEGMAVGVPRKDVIRAFRAIGKSYLTSAFAIWRLMRNPRDEKIVVVSASSKKAKEFVDQVKGIIESFDLCKWLFAHPRESGAFRRDKADEFDVSYASLTQAHSVKAVGISGQITGSRATLLVADDMEIPQNSKTEDARITLISTVRNDFAPIVKTEHGRGDIIFLGTPQTEESMYNTLVEEMGYDCFCLPVRFPMADKMSSYILEREDKSKVNILAYYLRNRQQHGDLGYWEPTDTRYTEDELHKAEAEGRLHFMLQYMLDTELADAERYPLKQFDLMVFGLNPIKAPRSIQWGHDSQGLNRINDIKNVGFSGDYMMRPLFVDDEWREYEGKVLFVDPAGRGKDECSWSIVAQLNGMLFLLRNGAHKGDPMIAMRKLAMDAKAYNVDVIEIEPNYGQGMFMAALQPILMEIWGDLKHEFIDPKVQRQAAREVARRRMRRMGSTTARVDQDTYTVGCSVQESEWAKGQKETRIIDTLEPVLTTHRLVVDEVVVRQDLKEVAGAEREYSLMYQLTHITKDRQALKHEDRLESLAGAINHFQRTVVMDAKQATEAQRRSEFDKEIEDWINVRDASAQGRRVGKRRADGSRDEVHQWSV